MYINANFDKFKHIYDIEKLKQYSNWCDRDIKGLEEVIEKLKQYQMEIYEHAQTVVNTEFQNVVTLVRRRDYYTNRVKYHVQLAMRPIVAREWIENEKVYGPYKHEKMFTGKERHLALKYAKDLAKQYNCEIERKGF
ncbi:MULTISPECIES: hypothetical protein [Bacillus]|uniref:hypothetical protein n=1 Tax=Bacillus TaxID=1386 RepID=UPI0015745B6E|nr:MULTISPECIES: hypothetical protein [Bacillus]MBC6975100.1 hypothetical protein [Bacillus sp. Xin]MBY0600390.1 hypothetical protein [Bacillus bingmayongensis]NSW38429.1 hypothetical protein [Bacillus sp. Xin1]